MERSRRPRAEHVIVVSIDGLKPEYYLEERWPAPAMRQVLCRGAHARAVRSIFPSLTYPSHTTMATGALPARHGIWSNRAVEPMDDPPWLSDAGLIRVGRSAGHLNLRSGGGDVIVHRAEAPVDAETKSGDVTIGIPAGVSRLRVNAVTGGGNISLQVPPGFGADVDATVITSSTNPDVIQTDLRGLTIVRDSAGGKTRIRATGKINGGGQKVILRANEGIIQIRTAGVR